MTGFKNLFREIHRRSIWQVVGVYLAVSWVALQVVETLVDSLGLPGWLPGVAIILLILGLPIIIATAFVQRGIGPTQPAARPFADPADRLEPPGQALADSPDLRPRGEPSAPQRLFTWRNALLGGLGAAAAWGIIATGLLFAGGEETTAGTEGVERIAIAVLPFASRGSDEQSEVFSLGLHDDLLTRLSKIGSLRVTSRTSVMEYGSRTASIPDIADELGVSHILEGSVVSAGGQINLNAQLIDGDTDEHLWAETYNRPLTVENVFQIQRELAEKITESLSAALLPEEAAELAAAPTANLEAYNVYLRGHTYYQQGPRSQGFETAIELYERAVELDPEFAEAWARLGMALGMRYEVLFGSRADPAMLERALEASHRALELRPDLPEAHLALGQYYYTGERNLDLAFENLTQAGQNSLNNGDLFHLLGAVQRRRGEYEEALSAWEEMVRIDPKSPHYHEDLGSWYAAMGRFEESERVLNLAIELAPEVWGHYYWLAWTYWSWDESTNRALEVLDRAPDGGSIRFTRREFALEAGDFEGALEGVDFIVRRARVRDLQGHPSAPALLDSARVVLESRAEENPELAGVHSDLGYIYAALDREEDARRSADRALELLSPEMDRLEGVDQLYDKAVTLVRLGALEEAFEVLARVQELSPPGINRGVDLARDPFLAPLRDHADFVELTSQD